MNRFVWAGIALISAILILGTVHGDFAYSGFEVVGFITGLVSVWLAVKNSPWNWPIGNIECAAYLILFLNVKLYANAFLQAVFIVIGFWGWYQWLRGGKNATPRPLSKLSTSGWVGFVISTIVCTLVVTQFVTAINGAAPFWDTLTTALSLVATYIMGRRHLGNWLVWMGTDVIYIALFYSQGLYLTTFLYFLFLLMCIRGYWEWQREIVKLDAAHDTGPDHREVLPVS
jgi:nicotinamide mononucleotide transporter